MKEGEIDVTEHIIHMLNDEEFGINIMATLISTGFKQTTWDKDVVKVDVDVDKLTEYLRTRVE